MVSTKIKPGVKGQTYSIGGFPQALVSLLKDVPGLGNVVFVLHLELELSVRKPHLDVLRLDEEASVQVPGSVSLFLLALKVDVGFPENLGHVKSGLLHRQLVYSPASKETICFMVVVRE